MLRGAALAVLLLLTPGCFLLTEGALRAEARSRAPVVTEQRAPRSITLGRRGALFVAVGRDLDRRGAVRAIEVDPREARPAWRSTDDSTIDEVIEPTSAPATLREGHDILTLAGEAPTLWRGGPGGQPRALASGWLPRTVVRTTTASSGLRHAAAVSLVPLAILGDLAYAPLWLPIVAVWFVVVS